MEADALLRRAAAIYASAPGPANPIVANYLNTQAEFFKAQVTSATLSWLSSRE